MSTNNLYENVKTLAKANRIKLGELEKEVGVSTGYFSRESENPMLVPVLKVADKFSIDVHKLMYGDLSVQIQLKAIDEEIEELKKRKAVLELKKGGVV